jgi:cytochrome c553
MARRAVSDRPASCTSARTPTASRALGGMATLRKLVAGSLLVGLVASCANIDRSRNTANPNVSGGTLAMQVCSNCHGPTGNSVSPNFPNLAQQQEAYIAAQLHEFKAHSRSDPAGFEYMWGLSHNLTDKQVQELAAHFASQKLEPQRIEAKPERIAAGKAIFTNGLPAQGIPACAGCHGPDGMGNAEAPRIAGQHVDYLVKQLKVFQRSNERPQGAVMKTVAHQLTKQNIDNVSAYLQARPRL